jgi:hypothetical protein
LDHTCIDEGGQRGTVLSDSNCAEVWPNAEVSSCPAALTISESKLETQRGKIEFINVFNTATAEGYFVGHRPRTCGITGGEDRIRVCRGFTSSFRRKPSCWFTFEGSNDGRDWFENFNLFLDYNFYLASYGIFTLAGQATEFYNSRESMTALFAEVCLDNWRLNQDDIEEFWFQGHSKGGGNALVAAYYFTTQDIGVPASRTNIMTTGSYKPFPVGAIDTDYRDFKSVTLYQTIQVLIQETSNLVQGKFWETYRTTYDLVYDLPGAYQHLPDPQNGASSTVRKQIVSRRKRQCTKIDLFKTCTLWTKWEDDGYWVMDDWKDVGMGRCTAVAWECLALPDWDRHDFGQYLGNPESCWGDGTYCLAGMSCTKCCNGDAWRFDKTPNGQYCGPPEPCWGDGTLCAAGTSCSMCCNGDAWHFDKTPNGQYCGPPEPCWGDGTLCAAGTSCSRCCNGDAWRSDKTPIGQYCGPPEPCWGDGTYCLVGSSCSKCCSGSAWRYDKSPNGQYCGPPEPCWGDGTLCAAGTSCSRCCNGNAWRSDKTPIGQYCGPPEPCWGSNIRCLAGTSCSKCCRGYRWVWEWFGDHCN